LLKELILSLSLDLSQFKVNVSQIIGSISQPYLFPFSPSRYGKNS